MSKTKSKPESAPQEKAGGDHRLSNCSASLANDVARCNGVGFEEYDGWDWREGCETCLRRTATRGEKVWMMTPPAIIAFECEFLILPNASVEQPALNKTP